MKCKYTYLLFFFLFVFIFQSFQVYSQSILDKKISLEIRNVSFQRALKLIEQEADIKFAYSPDNFENRKVTFSRSNRSIGEILREILGEGISFETVGNVVILKRRKETAQIILQGTVSDAGGTLPGVTVLEKGANYNGVSTDGTGRFRIELVGDSNKVIVRAIGYEPREILVNSSRQVDIVLEQDETNLDEIVVVGFGTQRKINLVGSVSTIGREEIQQTPSASLQNALTGKLSGYFSQQRGGRPGEDGADFVIRGISTYNGNIRPLILVDDIEFSYDDFSNIDPNEIQSLSILKDAGSTAVYGIKGANGVILVTTRRGSEGAPKVNYRTEFGVQKPVHIPKVLSSADMAMLRNEALKNDAFISGGQYVPDYTDNEIALFKNGNDPFGYPNIDWYNTLFRDIAPLSSHNLDLLGGTERVKYFISLGSDLQSGLLRSFGSDDVDNNYSFRRYNFRTNLDIKATNSLNLRLDVAGNNTITKQPQVRDNPFGEIYNYEALTPYVYPIYNPDGSFGFTDPLKAQPAANNIVGRITHGGYHRNLQNLINVNFSAIQNLSFLTPGLNLKITASISNANTSTRSLTRFNFPSFYYDSLTGSYTPRNSSVFRVDPYNPVYNPGSPRRQTGLQSSLNYQRSFGDHTFSGLVVLNQYSKLSASSANTDPDLIANYIPFNARGLASRLSYNYKSRYILEATGAYNGSDRFAVSRRYGFFPAVLAGWVISEEDKFKRSFPIVSLLKIRGSYGLTGSDDLGNFKNSYEEIYQRIGEVHFGITDFTSTVIQPGTLANTNVSWEKESKLDLGLEFGILQNRLSGSLSYFSNRRSDILSKRNTVPGYFGIPTDQLPPLNLGIVSNSGYEVELAFNGKLGRNTSYNVQGNYSYAHNTILEIDEVNPKYPWKRLTGQSIGSDQGFIWDGFYSVEEAKDRNVPKYIGSATAAWGPGTTLPGFLKYRDLNGDGVISDDDRGYFGLSNLPTTIIGLSGNLKYKNLSLNVVLQSALNYDLQIGYSFSVPFKGNLQEIHLNRWTPETASTAEFPSLVSNFHGTYMSTNSNSNFWAIRGDYLRLKSLEFSYVVPKPFIQKIGLASARVYLSGYNLLTWSATFRRYGVDPEVLRQSTDPQSSIEYPNQAIFNLGVNLALK